MKKNQNVRSGNRMVVLADGDPVGLAQNVRMSDSYGLEPASGIGDIHVVEHVPTRAGHAISISKMVLATDNLREKGVVPENGEAALRGLVFDIVKMDKDTGQPLRTYRGCSFDSGDIEVAKHAIVVSSAQFLALDVSGTGL